ncbi:hypothetical protein BH23VER1_BH23VER1_20350 [soil metagenome]
MSHHPLRRPTSIGFLLALALPAFTASATTLLHYDFTEGSGTSVTDRSGSNNHGTLISFGDTSPGAGTFGITEGWVEGGGLSFLDDSVRSYVSTPLSQSAVNGGSFTVEFTASADRPDNPNSGGSANWTPAIGSSHGPSFSADETFFLGIDQNLSILEVRVPGLGGGIGSPDVPIPWSIPGDQSDPTAYHVALTFDATTNEFELFVDGLSMGSEFRSALLPAFSEFIIGNTGHQSNEQWDGVIYGVAISDERLAPSSFVLPRNPAPFVITSVIYDSDLEEATLTWNASSGRVYAVDFSEDLAVGGGGAPSSWQELTNNVVATAASATFTESDVNNLDTPQRFYRVRDITAP